MAFYTYDRFIILAVAIWFKKHLNQVFSNLVRAPKREIHKEILQAKQVGFGAQKREFYKEILQAKQVGLKRNKL